LFIRRNDGNTRHSSASVAINPFIHICYEHEEVTMTRMMLASMAAATLMAVGCSTKEEVKQAPAEAPAPVEAPAAPVVDSAAIKDSIAKAEAAAKEAAEAEEKAAKKKAAPKKKAVEEPKAEAAKPVEVKKEAAPTQQIRKSR